MTTIRTGRPLTRAVAVVTAAVLALLAGIAVGAVDRAHAANPGIWDAGHIITDAAFYDSGSMSTADITAFIDAKGSACRPGGDGTPCLKDFRQDTVDRPADTRCTAPYVGAPGETAAGIIGKVARACGISPRVLLVMLQKEQSLVTGSGAGLYASRYKSAMGFACPDTAPCDPRYEGFFNQVYQAAWRFRDYALTPARWNHRAGVVNNVRYHPNAGCGSSPVLIRNQATASLYNYTPYQPNAAALAAGSGLGDTCSAYGNRNFFRYYTAWFGAPNGTDPIGAVDGIAVTNAGFTLSGWVLDPDTFDPTDAHVYVDGVGHSVRADGVRPDIATVFRRGDRHGFSTTVAATPGPHSVCTFAITVGPGSNTLLECRVITVPDVVPIGSLEAVTTSGTTVTVSGWTLDADTTEPNHVHVYVDGAGTAAVADRSRPDVAAAFGRGDRHGFSVAVTAEPGNRTVCAYGINTAAGPHTLLGCRVVLVGATRAPIGSIDAVSVSGAQLTVTGWTMDPDTSAPNPVHVYIDGVGASLPADLPRPDVAAAFGNGDRHGYSHTRTLTPGQHQVCVYGINTGLGDHTPLGCRSVSVGADRVPLGAVDAVTASGSTVTVSGWTLDPDTSAPNPVHVYVDGVGSSQLADLPRPDVAAAFGNGDRHGFVHTRTVPPGQHQVCVFGINTGPFPHTTLGCYLVTTT